MLAFVATASVVRAQGGPGTEPHHPTGNYKVSSRGDYSGEGHAAVGANSVNLQLQLINPETGISGNLHIPHMVVKDGRFKGTGTFAGRTVSVSGRVDAPDGRVVKKARLMGTISISDGTYCRVVGERESS